MRPSGPLQSVRSCGGAFVIVAAASTGMCAPPASAPSQPASLVTSVVAGLVPVAGHVQCGAGRLPLGSAVTIVLDRDASATTRYAAESLQAELARLFAINASASRERGVAGNEGVSIFVDDANSSPLFQQFPRLKDLPVPEEDGYRLGVFPREKKAVIVGAGGNGAIRGAFALVRLAVSDGDVFGWPEVLISDAPDVRMRFTRDIFGDQGPRDEVTTEEKLTTRLDWWARWGLNYALMPNGVTQSEREQDALVRWFVEAAHSRGMKAGISLGGRSLCPSDAAAMDAYLSKARHLLGLGCDFFLILFDDLPRDRLGGHCEQCVRRFGGSLATEQRFILDAVCDILSESGSGRQLIWCPTYYSLGMTGYIGGAEGPDAYFSILGQSARVRQAYMFHCAFDRGFNAYLGSKGLRHRVWWYNGIRTEYYMVNRDFGDYEGWGPRPRIPGLKDFHSFFPPFENGWLMPGYASANPSLHPCVAPLVQAARDAHRRTIIPPASWQELAHLPECMEGVYLCGASAPYHIALAGVFGAHPAHFDQHRAEEAILDDMFFRGGSRYAVPWQRAYARAQMLLAEAQGRPLESGAFATIKDLLTQMETMERLLRALTAEGRPALPRPLTASVLDEMTAWRIRIGSLARVTRSRETP